MKRQYLCIALLLCACVPQQVTPTHSDAAVGKLQQQVETFSAPKNHVLAPVEVEIPVSASGALFLAKFSTSSALNSRRSFVSDYHGEVRITLLPHRQLECRFWAEGRITDPTVYEGPDGNVKAISSLCKGRLQRDGTFEFQGAYVSDEPKQEDSDALDATFTLTGKIVQDTLVGQLQLGGVYSNAVTFHDPHKVTDAGQGVLFEAVLTQ